MIDVVRLENVKIVLCFRGIRFNPLNVPVLYIIKEKCHFYKEKVVYFLFLNNEEGSKNLGNGM